MCVCWIFHDRISLCILGCSRTSYVDQAGLDLPVSASWPPGLFLFFIKYMCVSESQFVNMNIVPMGARKHVRSLWLDEFEPPDMGARNWIQAFLNCWAITPSSYRC